MVNTCFLSVGSGVSVTVLLGSSSLLFAGHCWGIKLAWGILQPLLHVPFPFIGPVFYPFVEINYTLIMTSNSHFTYKVTEFQGDQWLLL